MNSLLPSLEFINAKTGKVLPYDEDGIQYTKQYQGFWRARVNGNYQGIVYLDSSPLFLLEQVLGKPNEWQIPNFQKRINNFNTLKQQGKISWQDFLREKSKIENEKKRVTGSGYIKAILMDNNEPICEQILVISPGNLTEEEFNQMIKEIGQLALSAVSCTHHSMDVGQSEKVGIEGIGQQWHPGDGLIMRATALLELYQVIKNYWTLLEKRSLKSLVKEITPIRIDKIHQSPQALMKAKLEPHKKMILGFNNIESNNCSENEFICYLLDVYLTELSLVLIDSLKSLDFEEIDPFSRDFINNLSSITPINNSDFNSDLAFQKKREDLTNIALINQERRSKKIEINQTIKRLRECANWSKKVRKSNFLQDIQTPKSLPDFSSRLQGSSGYGSIFAKFSNSLGGVLKPIEKVIYLLQHTYERRIKTTNELYEIWCFIKLYTAFIIYVNMKPANNTFLFDKIKITNNEVKIPNIKYILEFDHDTNYRLVFLYDAKVTYNHNGNQGYKRPDIRIELLHNNQKIQFFFDAKYKNYSDWDVGNFIDDVLGTARDSYYSLLQSKASFLLHTDPKFDYWGEKPLTRLSGIKSYVLDNNLIKGSINKSTGNYKTYELVSNVENESQGYCGHKYGAICLQPNETSEKQIKRILRLILQYHCSFDSLCPSCGHQGIEKIYSCKRAGKCYSCENCQEFWVISHCQSSIHHPLIKFKDSFHQKSNPNSQQWLYDCPICGDQFTLSPEIFDDVDCY